MCPDSSIYTQIECICEYIDKRDPYANNHEYFSYESNILKQLQDAFDEVKTEE